MKKNWKNPELKNLNLESTKATECPNLSGATTFDLSVWDCIKCGFNGHNHRCDKCGGCKHPDYEYENKCWPAYKKCECKQGS